jgi:hypothetical protein
MGRIVEPADFNNLVVGNRGTYSVKLSDVGYAEDGAEEPRTEARLNGQPAVTLVVSKQSGQNTVAVADAVKERCRRFKKRCRRDSRRSRRRPVDLHQGFDRSDSDALDRRQYSRGDRRVSSSSGVSVRP